MLETDPTPALRRRAGSERLVRGRERNTPPSGSELDSASESTTDPGPTSCARNSFTPSPPSLDRFAFTFSASPTWPSLSPAPSPGWSRIPAPTTVAVDDSAAVPPQRPGPPPLPFELWQLIARIIREDYQDADHPRRVCDPVHSVQKAQYDESGHRCGQPKGSRGGWRDAQQTLARLARTSQLLYDAVSPILYHSPIVRHLDAFLGLAHLDTSTEGSIVGVQQSLPTLEQPILAALSLSRSPSLSFVRNLHIIPEGISPELFAACRAAHDAHQASRRCVLRHLLARCPAYAPLRAAVLEYKRRLLVVLAAAVFVRCRGSGSGSDPETEERLLLPGLETVCLGTYDLHTSTDARPWVHPHAMSEMGHRDPDSVQMYHALMHVVCALQPRVVHLRTSDDVRRWPKRINAGHILETVFRERVASAMIGGYRGETGTDTGTGTSMASALPIPRMPRFEVHLAAPGSVQVCLPLIYGAPVRVRLYIPNKPRPAGDEHKSEDITCMMHAVRRLLEIRNGSHSWKRLLSHRAQHYEAADSQRDKSSLYVSVALDMDIILPVLPISRSMLDTVLRDMDMDDASREMARLREARAYSDAAMALSVAHERANRQLAHHWMVDKMRDFAWRSDKLCGRSYRSTGGKGDEIRWGSVLPRPKPLEMDGDGGGSPRTLLERGAGDEVVQLDGWDRLLKEWPEGDARWDTVYRECLALGVDSSE